MPNIGDTLKQLFNLGPKDTGSSEINSENVAARLLAFLERALPPKLYNNTTAKALREFKKADLAHQNRYLPGLYLAYEHQLLTTNSELALEKKAFREDILKVFPELNELPEMQPIFATPAIQEHLLCTSFLKEVLAQKVATLGTKSVTVLQMEEWLSKPVESNDDNNEHSLIGYSKSIATQCLLKVGDQLTHQLFIEAYNNVAQQYSLLESFPSIILLMPTQCLDTHKIALLNKRQMEKFLFEKIHELESLNTTLQEKNAELLRTQQSLAESQNETNLSHSKFETILQTVQEGIIVANARGIITLVNRQIERIFGYEASEMIGQDLRILMPEAYRGFHQHGMTRYLETRESHILNTLVTTDGQHKDGHLIPIEINVSEMILNEEVFFTAAIRDITKRIAIEKELIDSKEELEDRVKRRTTALEEAQTELQKTNKELERSNLELEQFAYIVSHDLQAPLRMIGNYTQLLSRRYSEQLDADARDFIGFSVDGVKQMSSLINDLLAYSRAGNSREPLDWISLNDVTFLVENNLKGFIEETGTILSFKGASWPEILAIRVLMLQLFQNLIENAIKFAAPNRPPYVQVGFEEQATEWLFYVKDNGIGIPESKLEKVFIIFQRLETDTPRKGTGIGLAVCKRIVERHNGRIWVESTLGEGSTFFFTIQKS